MANERKHGKLLVGMVVVLLLGAAACSSSSSTKSGATTSSKTSTASTSSTSPSSSSTSSSSATTGSGGAAAFCATLLETKQRSESLVPKVAAGDPMALEEIAKDNAAVLAAAPSELHDALAKVQQEADLARTALQATGAARATASANMLAMTKDPSFKAAVATYTQWVNAHCGADAAKITGLGG